MLVPSPCSSFLLSSRCRTCWGQVHGVGYPWRLGLGTGPSRCPPSADGPRGSGGEPADSGWNLPDPKGPRPSPRQGAARTFRVPGCPAGPRSPRGVCSDASSHQEPLRAAAPVGAAPGGVAQTCPGCRASPGWECVPTLGTGTAHDVVAPGPLSSSAAGSPGQRMAVGAQGVTCRVSPDPRARWPPGPGPSSATTFLLLSMTLACCTIVTSLVSLSTVPCFPCTSLARILSDLSLYISYFYGVANST